MKMIAIKNCFSCPLCVAGSYEEDGELYNVYKCRDTGKILENERNTIDIDCTLQEINEDMFDSLMMLKQTFQDIEHTLEYERGSMKEIDIHDSRVIYDFLSETLGFEKRI